MRAGGAVAAPSMISNLATVSLSLNALGPLPVPAARHTADHATQRRPASPAPAVAAPSQAVGGPVPRPAVRARVNRRPDSRAE